MNKYRTKQRLIVRLQPSAFAPELRRLPRHNEFIGWPHADPAWVVRLLGGFVRRLYVEVV